MTTARRPPTAVAPHKPILKLRIAQDECGLVCLVVAHEVNAVAAWVDGDIALRGVLVLARQQAA